MKSKAIDSIYAKRSLDSYVNTIREFFSEAEVLQYLESKESRAFNGLRLLLEGEDARLRYQAARKIADDIGARECMQAGQEQKLGFFSRCLA